MDNMDTALGLTCSVLLTFIYVLLVIAGVSLAFNRTNFIFKFFGKFLLVVLLLVIPVTPKIHDLIFRLYKTLFY